MVDRSGMVAMYSTERLPMGGDYTLSRLSKPSYYSHHSDALAQEAERQRLANRLSGANKSRSSSSSHHHHHHHHSTPRTYTDAYSYSDAQYALPSRSSRSPRADDYQPTTRIKVDRATGAILDVCHSRPKEYDGVATPVRDKKSSKSSKAVDELSKKKKKKSDSGGSDSGSAHSDNYRQAMDHIEWSRQHRQKPGPYDER